MGSEEVQSVILEAKKSHFRLISKLTDEDVKCVWDSASDYISRSMSAQKGVVIQKLGTFTFSQQKLDVGNNKSILIQRPIFIISERFATTHALQTAKPYTDGRVPVVPLNFAAISQDIGFDRSTVEQCIKEVLLALSRALDEKKTVEFIFPTIGKLIIKNSKVKMKFYKDFLQTIDASGAVSNALRNRPETSDSVISRSPTPAGRHSVSSQIVYFPSIHLGEDRKENKDNSNVDNSANLKGRPPMPMITEECETKATDEAELQSDGHSSKQEEIVLLNEKTTIEKRTTPQGPKTPTRLKTAPENREITPHFEVGPLQKDVTFDSPNFDQRKLQQTPPVLKPISPVYGKLEKSSKSEALDPVKNRRSTGVIDNTCSTCIHDAGQELCYLCYQRARRNKPVYFHEERKRKELEEDRLLQQYQHIKDYEAILKDQGIVAANKEEAQKVAAFNLGVAEAVKTKKNERAENFQRSFIFYKRPVSPPASLSQKKYHMDLAEQVKQREKSILKKKKEKDFTERLEQVHLAEDLIAQREQYLKSKRQQSEEYKRALDTQVRFKPFPLSRSYPDSEHPLFGKHELDHGKMLEKRRENRRLFEDQLNAAAEKKKNAILNDLKVQKEESMMLTRAKTDLLEEMIKRNRDRVTLRRDLEDTWHQAAKHKYSRELEEKQRAQSPGVLLHDQCSRYKKCKSCERKLVNCGESNIWCESRYLSGSRIIV